MSSGRQTPWLLIVYSGVLLLVATWQLLWLAWKFVPMHAALLAGIGVALPLETRVCIAAAQWTVRLLPFVVVSCVLLLPVVVGVGALLAVKWQSAARFVHALVACALLLALGEILLAGVAVHSIHAAYALAASDPQVQDTLRSYEEFRHRGEPVANPAPEQQ